MPKLPLTPKQEAFFSNKLFDLLTVGEAAALASRSTSTIRYHITKNNLLWRKTDRGFYLIERSSLIAYYPHAAKLRAG